MTCGIYCIENKINKKKYIGRSINIELRFISHKNCLNRKDKKRENNHLLYAWHKYGEKNFKFYIIEKCEPKLLNEREIYYIKKIKTKHPGGYNFTDGGEGVNGYTHSKKTIKKISGKNNHRYGKCGKESPFFGKHHTKKTKEKLRKTFLKEKSPVFGTKKSNAYSKYFGVSIHNHKSYKKGKEYFYIYYVSKLRVDKKYYCLGYFKNEVSAAEAYDIFVLNNNLKNPINFENKNYNNNKFNTKKFAKAKNIKI